MPNYLNVNSVDLYSYFKVNDGLVKKSKNEIVLKDEDECGYYVIVYDTDDKHSTECSYDLLWQVVADKSDTPFDFDTELGKKLTHTWHRIINVNGSSPFALMMCKWEYNNEDEDYDGWEEVYSKQMLDEGTYYQTYGGGPEGGYLSKDNGQVLSIQRNWFQPYESEEWKNVEVEYEPEMNGVPKCRLVEVR